MQIDHLEGNLSSDLEFVKIADDSIALPEQICVEKFNKVVSLCTQRNHKK